MAKQKSGCPIWLTKLYGTALYLYPKSFRDEYRAQMLQAFNDQYQRRRTTNPILFYLDTINDLGNSMNQEHFSAFSQHGRIRTAVIGLCLAFGLLALRPFLVNSLTDGFSLMANADREIDTRLHSDYSSHRLEISRELLLSNEPMSVITGAQTYSELRFDASLKMQDTTNVKERVAEALKTAANDSSVLLAAYSLCASDPGLCNAEKVLARLQVIAPENGMTWLYSAAAAIDKGDQAAQQTYLRKAENAQFFDDYRNVLNARLHAAYAKHSYELPWYSFMAQNNDVITESFVLPIENFAIPGCDKPLKSQPDIQAICGSIAKRIASQPGNSLPGKLSATSLAVKLGNGELQPELDLLRQQNNAYTEAVLTKNIVAPDELAKAYANGRQYAFALQTIEKFQLAR